MYKMLESPATYQILTKLPARLLKHLAAMGSIYETGPNEYVSTPFSKALKDPIYRDGYPTLFVLLFVLQVYLEAWE